jgi:hypothetical protein
MRLQSFLMSRVAHIARAYQTWDTHQLGPIFYIGVVFTLLWMFGCSIGGFLLFPSALPMFLLPVGMPAYLVFMFIDDYVMNKRRKEEEKLTKTYFGYRQSIDSLRQDLGLTGIYKEYEPRGTYCG